RRAAVSTRLIFVSEANKAYAAGAGLGDPALAVLIRSGVKLSDFPPPGVRTEEVKASLGTGMHKPLVLSVGNLKPQKNAGDFLKAARKVLAEVPEARFVFVGDGPLRPSLEARAMAEGLAGKVLFPGWRRDVPRLLAAADVFVLTSLWEGLPRSLVEAMKTGLPGICYDTDGVRDLLRDGENGFLIAQGDWEALAAGIVRLLQDKGLRGRLGKAASESIGPEFDIDGMVRTQEKLYSHLLMNYAGSGLSLAA
ncbi:MAG: glycosyltransferase, partial [Elusimicrobiota bacterium]